MAESPDSKSNPEISFVVPIYREAQRLPEFLQNLQSFTAKWRFPLELVVAQDHSSEAAIETEILRRQTERGTALRLQILTHSSRQGRGPSVANALLTARGNYVFVLSADLNVPLAEILNTLQDFREQPAVDLIIGNRFDPKKMRHGERGAFVTAFESAARERYQRLAPDGKLHDPTCPFVAIRGKALAKWTEPLVLGRWFYTPGLLSAAMTAGLAISEKAVVCHDSKETRFGWREAWAHLV